MYTDASRLGGLAYVLVQPKEGKQRAIIQCGSTALTDTQRNYSTTELELLGVLCGLQKAAFYCKGAPKVSIFSDHSALVTLTKKELIKIENTRIVAMLEKLIDYNFEIFHLPGTQNVTADFLSRHTLPSKEAPEFPRGKRLVLVKTVRSQKTTWEDGSLWKLAEKTSECQETKN